jgi:riboflavin biosynthesis pyrimidine reductase
VRQLLPLPLDPVDLDRVYASPRPDWLRVNFISAVDGAATLAGRSRDLQVPSDSAVFATLRGLADVVLVGAGTARAEGYGPARPNAERRAARRATGLAEVPPIAVVTGSGDPGLPTSFYTDAEVAPLVLTTQAAAREIPGAVVVPCGETSVDPALAIAALRERGLAHIVCEGGPHWFAQLVAAGLVDELCLTIVGQLVGPGPARVVAGEPWAGPAPATLTTLLTDDAGTLFARYSLSGSPDSTAARS